MKLHYPALPIEKGYTNIVNPSNSPLKTIQFGRICLDNCGEVYCAENKGRESVLDILKGTCSIKLENNSFGHIEYNHIGCRKNVFLGNTTMIYLPCFTKYTIVSETESLDIAMVEAPSSLVCSPTLVTPECVNNLSVGNGNWQRSVNAAVGSDVKAARLMVGETINPAGNWSGWPPHKHDTVFGGEEIYEELYFFLVDPPQGFGMIRLYSNKENKDDDSFDEAYVIQNGDVIAIPSGYHTVTVAPGYRLFYIWALSGEKRKYGQVSEDKNHVWIKNL